MEETEETTKKLINQKTVSKCESLKFERILHAHACNLGLLESHTDSHLGNAVKDKRNRLVVGI